MVDIGFISLIIAIMAFVVSLIVILWDHLIDDWLLNKRVQEFYEDFENLIYSLYKRDDADQRINDKKRKRESYDEYKTLYFDNVIKQLKYRGKIEEKYNDYGKYLGLVKYGSSYLNYSDFLVEPAGRLKIFRRDINAGNAQAVKDPFRDSETNQLIIGVDQVNMIETWLEALRIYWKKFHKGKNIIRRKLKPKVNFREIINQK
ncbi:hypothetical protein LCGC14_0718600 [marine sediment metagenome]|uniref:Uncharacterized protein n=1 Tax=marine sediment metagenome TaxID=412755 RepID=A0A0F9QD36_9ZZZZ